MAIDNSIFTRKLGLLHKNVEFGARNLNQAAQPKTDIFIISSTRVTTLQDFLTSGNYDIKIDPKIEIINIKTENQIHIELTGG